ncbi:hypothetical protein [Mycolicibacterium sp. XJ879]
MAAGLVAAVYRFPVPFGGYANGFDGIPTAALASVFYLALGGVVVLGGFGAAAGTTLAKLNPQRAGELTVMAALMIAIAGAVSLALLEYVIGPW